MILDPQLLKQYREQLDEAIRLGEYTMAAMLSERLSDGRVAQILLDVEEDHLFPFLSQLSAERAASIVSHLPVELSAEFFEVLEEEHAVGILEEMAPDHAVDLLNLLPDSRSDRFLGQLPTSVRESLEGLRKYEWDQVGAYMTPAFVGVPAGSTIAETLAAIQDVPENVESRSYIYVVNRKGGLSGVASVKDLIRSNPSEPIDRVMNPDVVAVHADEDALEAAQLIRNRRIEMMPVVDTENRLIGVMLLDDAIRILSRNLVDQFVKIGAASREESFYTPPLGSVRKRLPWMAVNVFLNLGAVAVISSFEGTIETVAALAVFLPMITDMGGNVGIQALSVSIRSIALGEVRLSEYWRAASKEIVVGLINGLALGLLFAIIAVVLRGSPVLGLVAGSALAVNVLVAGIVGGTLPFLIKRMGYDPAMMTGPVLTTITDITGVSIYLGLSTVFLSSLMIG